MTDKINQLCEIINKNPSKINLINEAILEALNAKSLEGFQKILNMIVKIYSVNTENQVDELLQSKLKAIFCSLLQLKSLKGQEKYYQLLTKSYDLAKERQDLIEEFFVRSKKIDWTANWPTLLLQDIADNYSKKLLGSLKENQLETILNFVTELPAFEELFQTEKHAYSFKRSFQTLILNILSGNLTQQIKLKIYHSLGSKIISKLHQPLCLANHCLQTFQQSPQIRIQILSCLFVLVGKYGLQLQKFYPKLQEVIRYRSKHNSIYELPNSRRFFKLLQAALRSSKIPFTTINQFTEIIIRQVAREQGNFAFWAISLIVNLTKKHRKLIDTIPKMPQITCLKHHYNPKIRGLVEELFKNLNKVDYLQIQDFTNVSFKSIADKKVQSALSSLDNRQLEFRVPIFEEQL